MDTTIGPSDCLDINGTVDISSNVSELVVESWRQYLDTALTIIPTINTVFFMIGMGSALSITELWGHTKKPVGLLIGIFGQFIVLPAVGFCLSFFFKLQPYEALGVLMVSCCPGGTFSNFFTYWMNGDLALSMLMTAFSSVIAFGGMPLNLWLYSQYYIQDENEHLIIPYMSIATTLFFITIPGVVGMIIRHYNKRVADIVTKVTGIMGWFGVLIAMILTIFLYWRIFTTATPLIYVAALLLPFVGFIITFFIARFTCQSHKLARTVGIEAGCQNMAVATSIILLSYTQTELRGKIMLFPTLYIILLLCEAMVVIGGFHFVNWLINKPKKDDEYMKTQPNLTKLEMHGFV